MNLIISSMRLSKKKEAFQNSSTVSTQLANATDTFGPCPVCTQRCFNTYTTSITLGPMHTSIIILLRGDLQIKMLLYVYQISQQITCGGS